MGSNLAPKFSKIVTKNRSQTGRPLDGSGDGFWTILGAKMEAKMGAKRKKNQVPEPKVNPKPIIIVMVLVVVTYIYIYMYTYLYMFIYIYIYIYI